MKYDKELWDRMWSVATQNHLVDMNRGDASIPDNTICGECCGIVEHNCFTSFNSKYSCICKKDEISK